MTPVFLKVVGQIDDLSIDLKLEFRISLTYLVLALLSVGLTAFFCFHSYLLWNNYTTIEFLEKRGFNPPPGHVNRFDLGAWRNLQSVMGENILLWWLPVRWTCRGDGMSFEPNPAFAPGYYAGKGSLASIKTL